MKIFKAIAEWFAGEGEEDRTPDEIVEGLTENQVRAYFDKNSDIDLSVPLAIARQVREEVTWTLSRGKRKMAADELAMMRGMLAGIARFEDLYCAALERRGRLKE